MILSVEKIKNPLKEKESTQVDQLGLIYSGKTLKEELTLQWARTMWYLTFLVPTEKLNDLFLCPQNLVEEEWSCWLWSYNIFHLL